MKLRVLALFCVVSISATALSRGNITADQIRDDNKQGIGALLQTSDGTGGVNHFAIFGSDGKTLTDGGATILGAQLPTVPGVAGTYTCTNVTVDSTGRVTAASNGTCTGGGGGSGSLILLESHTASSSAELDFTAWYSSTYDEYEIHVENLIPSAASIIGIQCSTNGGTSYDTASNYQWAFAFGYNGGGGGTGATASTNMAWRDTNSTPSTNQSYVGRIVFYGPATSIYKQFLGHLMVPFGGGNTALMETWGGTYLSTAAVNAFRILPSAGNLTSGTVRVYGVAH